MSVAAIVLAGGTSRRFGGGDKTAAPFGDTTVLGRLVSDLPDDWSVVCVGVERPLPRPATWTREEPPLGGPLAGIAAGLAALPTPGPEVVVLLAGDQPFAATAAPTLVARLAAEPALDAAAARREDGRPHLLLAAVRTDSLRAALPADPEGMGVHRALAGLAVRAVDVPTIATADVDTPADLAAAERSRPPAACPEPG